MKKRLLITLGLAILLTVTGVWALWTSPIEPGATEENFGKLHGGMSEKEVDAILGEPKEIVFAPLGKLGRIYPVAKWETNDRQITIRYIYENGNVKNRIAYEGEMLFHKELISVLRPRPKSFFEQVRVLFGL